MVRGLKVQSCEERWKEWGVSAQRRDFLGNTGVSTHPKGCVGKRVGARWGSMVGTVDRPISALPSLLPAGLPPKEGSAQRGGHGRSLTLAGWGGGMWTDVRGPSGCLQLLGGCRAVGVSKRAGGPASAGEGWRLSALLYGGGGVAHEVRGFGGGRTAGPGSIGAQGTSYSPASERPSSLHLGRGRCAGTGRGGSSCPSPGVNPRHRCCPVKWKLRQRV